MPLVRKPANHSPGAKPDASEVLQLLASSSTDERWAAARAAADVVGGISAIAAALPTEHDSRVREAMFTSLARHATAESMDALIGLLRSDSANLRTGALDTLRILAGAAPGLARSLPSAEATHLLCVLLAAEQEINVCAAAVDVLAEVGSSDALATLNECARRFGESPFIAFAIEIVIHRITSQSTPARA
jgi:hypothetical protein